MKKSWKYSVFLSALLLIGAFSPLSMYSYSKNNFTPYKETVKGFGNRLTLANILKLMSLPSNQARELLIKAGYKIDKSNNTLFRPDHYAQDPDNVLYDVTFKQGTKGFRQLIIYTQPEMRMIQDSFIAGGYSVKRVKPRKGARWTKIFQKNGSPTFSLSMLLLNESDKNARFLPYNEYVYCLICEKNI